MNLFQTAAHTGFKIVGGDDGLTMVAQTFAEGRWGISRPKSVHVQVEVPSATNGQPTSVLTGVRVRMVVLIPCRRMDEPKRFLLMGEIETLSVPSGVDPTLASSHFAWMVYEPRAGVGTIYFQDADPLETPLFQALMAEDPNAFLGEKLLRPAEQVVEAGEVVSVGAATSPAKPLVLQIDTAADN